MRYGTEFTRRPEEDPFYPQIGMKLRCSEIHLNGKVKRRTYGEGHFLRLRQRTSASYEATTHSLEDCRWHGVGKQQNYW